LRAPFEGRRSESGASERPHLELAGFIMKRGPRLFDRRSLIKGLSFAGTRSLRAEPRREVLGIKLRPPGGELLQRVENACRKSVIVRRASLRTNLAEGGIRADGTPVIEVLPELLLTEEFLVHELSHMELEIEGFPKVFFQGPADIIGNDTLLAWLRSNVLDVIQHCIFYPRLRRMGYAPDAARVEEIRQILDRGDFVGVVSTVDLASKYFRIIMEVANKKVISSVTMWYREKGWSEALALADRASASVQATVKWTPQAELDAFLLCANAFLRGRYAVGLLKMESEQHGSVTQWYGDLFINRS
jgi:hypothetical protein